MSFKATRGSKSRDLSWIYLEFVTLLAKKKVCFWITQLIDTSQDHLKAYEKLTSFLIA